jgi:hypothetical protein
VTPRYCNSRVTPGNVPTISDLTIAPSRHRSSENKTFIYSDSRSATSMSSATEATSHAHSRISGIRQRLDRGPRLSSKMENPIAPSIQSLHRSVGSNGPRYPQANAGNSANGIKCVKLEPLHERHINTMSTASHCSTANTGTRSHYRHICAPREIQRLDCGGQHTRQHVLPQLIAA